MGFDELYQALTGEPEDAPFHFRAHSKTARPDEPPRFSGVCRLEHDDGHFYASALLWTENPWNKAVKDNDFTWQLGDTLELFIQLKGHEDYYEFHSTPDGIRFQYHIPDHRIHRELPHEAKCCDAGLKLFNEFHPEKKVWYCVMTIPFSGIHADNPECRFLFSRYNYSDFPGDRPELSSWPFIISGFHAPHNWLEYPAAVSGIQPEPEK